MQTDAETKPQSKLDHALALARRGWPVFPLQENGKQPLPGSRGHLEATTKPDEIRARWTDALTGAALPYNIGVRPVAGEFSVADLGHTARRGRADELSGARRGDWRICRSDAGRWCPRLSCRAGHRHQRRPHRAGHRYEGQ